MLQSPFVLGSLVLPNRLVMPPLVIWKSDCSGLVTDDHLSHYAASAGPGLMIVEATCVAPDGKLTDRQLGIYEDTHVPGLRRLSEQIHSQGSVAGIQLHHAGAKTDLQKNCGHPPRVVSVTDKTPAGSLELTEADIELIINQFADAAERAVAAGFDVLEIHGAHGYLGSQFLSPAHNFRKDRWGGSLENRSRFLVEVIKAVSSRVADSKAVISCRLGVADSGLPYADGLKAAETFIDAGVQLLNISTAGGRAPAPADTQDGFSPIMQLGFDVRRDINRAVPVIGVGNIKTPQEADLALSRDEPVDLVAIGRAILADPAWAQKAFNHQSEMISLCINCRPCFHYTKPQKCPARKSGEA